MAGFLRFKTAKDSKTVKRVVFHIGPHKTGSTYIQRMMRVNRARFPESHRPVLKSAPLFGALHRASLGLLRPDQQADHLPLMFDIASELARNLDADNTLFSDEDLLGPLPSRHGIAGLYPYIDQTLPRIYNAFAAQGIAVQFFFYLRSYNDWLHSVHAYKFLKDKRSFAPKTFKARHQLPDNWTNLVNRMNASVGAENILYHSFEQDRATGRMGTALFRAFGLDDETLDRLDWIAPVNVSRPETVDPKRW